MARYTVEAPDGRRVTIEGDSEPTEADLEDIFNSLPQEKTKDSLADQLKSDAPQLIGSASQFIPGPLGVLANVASGAVENPMATSIGGVVGQKLAEGSNLSSTIANLLGANTQQPFQTTGLTSAKTDVGRATQGAMGIASMLLAARGIKSFNPKAQVLQDTIDRPSFANDVRSAFYEAKSSAVEKYGEGLEKLSQDNPDKIVDMKPVIDQLKQSISEDPKLRNVVRRVPNLMAMLDDAWSNTDLKITEAQNLVNDLQSKIASSKLRGLGVRSDDIPLLDAVHDIKNQMVESFPEIKELRSNYGDVVNKFNLLRSKIKPGSLLKNLETNFGDPEVGNAASDLLKEFPQIQSRIRNYNLLRKIGVGTVSAVGGAVGIKALESAVKSFSK